MKRLIFSMVNIVLFLFIYSHLFGQDVGSKTLISQSRSTRANVGKADITISYHSPSTNGRKIFGGIVPYDFEIEGKEFPWRAGANQRTTIEFSHDVKINGKELKAGIYGFLILVSKVEWTLIFSSGKSWGAFNYDPKNDVLRVPVKPQSRPFQEWLSYEFKHPKRESVEVELRWEETAISFNISTDATNNLLTDLTQKEEKSTEDYRQLAIWTLEQNPTQIDQALAYIDKSIALISEVEPENMQKVQAFFSKILKADLLIEKGRTEEGEKLKKDLLQSATGFNVYYYALRKYTVEGKKREAYQLLNDAIERHPENFQNHFAMGEYYLREKNQDKATAHFKQAYEMAVAQESGWQNYAQYLYLQNKLALESDHTK